LGEGVVVAIELENCPALLLVGGMGTRLRSVVPNTPKPLATVGDKSFLELLVRQLQCQGMRRLILCTGYLAEQIESHFGDGHNWDVSIQYSKEIQPLGTAGAIKMAGHYVSNADEFVVMNGDSFMEVDLHRLLRFHHERQATVSMAVRKVENASRYGTVEVNGDRVTGFLEKTGNENPGLVNAGVYIFKREVLEQIPEGPCSLEKDVFPHLLSRGVYALQQQGVFIDIGTPEDYARAQEICDRLYEAASLKQ
jgi:D-glycero-alpha-D-manno-heptose 1-phosphate guanylyltransferase